MAMPPQATVAAAMSTAMATTAPKKKSASSSVFSLRCGCKDAKSVSISSSPPDGSDKAADPVATSLSGRPHPPPAVSARPETSSADTITFTTATTSTSDGDDEEQVDNSPNFSGLLRQLSDLERSVASWEQRRRFRSGCVSAGETAEVEEEEEDKDKNPHRFTDDIRGRHGGRGKSPVGFDWKISHLPQDPRPLGHGRGHRRRHSEGSDRVLGKVGQSVAVVKQTEDPLGDFRRSMLQMIVEKEILSGEELQELLCRFLALNSPSHHTLIIQAFAEIYRDVFSGYGNGAADLLPLPPLRRHHRPQSVQKNRRHC